MISNSESGISVEKERVISFISKIEAYSKNRIKDEPVFEIISEGLKIFCQTENVEMAVFLSVDPQTFIFKVTTSEPEEKIEDANELYSSLLEKGFISEVLQSGTAGCSEIKDGANRAMVIPLSDPHGIQGLVIVEFRKENCDPDIYAKLFIQLAGQMALYIANNRLTKKNKSVKSLLEQKLAYRTESIKQKKRELQTIFDSINTGVFIIDKNSYEIVDVNNIALNMLGFDKASIIGLNRIQFSPHWNYNPDSDISAENSGEIIIFKNDESKMPVLNSIKLINLNAQEYLLESFIDISKIKSVEFELRNSEYRFRTIFENAPFGMALVDEELHIIECNNFFRNMVGYTFDELRYKKISDFVYNNDRLVFTKYFSTGILINKHNEIRLVDYKKDIFWCKITATILRYGAESVYYKLFMIEDITSIITSKDALFKQTNLLMGVADATNALLTLNNYEAAIELALESLGKASEVDRVYIAKNVGQGENANKNIILVYEWHSENSENFNKTFIPDEFTYSNFFPGWYEELADGRTIHGYINNDSVPGMRYIEPTEAKSILIVPIFVDSFFWGFIGFDDRKKGKVWSEVEESILKATAAGIGGAIKIKESQEELVKAKNKAEKSDQLKSEFLAQMSHEIRTPINSILSFSGLIKEEFEPGLSPEYRSCFNAINRAGDRIIRTVDMILNMSDLQTGSYEVNPSRYDLFDSIKANLAEEFLYKARERGLEFKVVKPEFPTEIKADEYTVNQIFANLIDNAIKYTSRGEVKVLFEEGSGEFFTAKVKDTGIGIADDFIPRMFDPFSQEEQGYTRRYEGNGLGLALVKKYCDLSNVGIKVASSKGEGTTFTLRFKKA